MPPQLILLPGTDGTDGTGALADEFVAACGDLPVTVLSYPPERVLDYAGLAAALRPQLPGSAPFVLVGESFGGPLALRLAAARPAGLRGVVLCASFARLPYAALRVPPALLRLAPVRGVPTALLAWWLLGRWSTPCWRARLRHALRRVPAAVLRARIAAAGRVDATALLQQLHVPVLYLRASEDRLVPRAAGTQVVANAPDAALVELQGPHFLLQAAPDACARAIRPFVARVCNE